MAEPEQKKTKKENGFLALLIALLIATALGAGAGYFIDQEVQKRIKNSEAGASPEKPRSIRNPRSSEEKNEKDGKKASQNLATEPFFAMLPPIITNLKDPPSVWVRIEIGIVIPPEEQANTNVLIAQTAEDMTAFMKTLRLQNLEGASGYLALEEDLNERVRIRSQGKIKNAVITTFIVE